jgi:hypothetical protein
LCAIAALFTAASGHAQPTLLPVPEAIGPGTPSPCCPNPLDESGRPLSYDRSLLYLPERNPSNHDFEARPRDERAFWGRTAFVIGQTRGIDGLRPDWRGGLDAATGVWWDSQRSRGAEAGVFFLADGKVDRIDQGLESSFTTAHADYRMNIGKVGHIKLDILAGYRFARVAEERAQSSISSDVSNQFHGGTVGIAGELRQGPWSLDARASIAYGACFHSTDGVRSRSSGTMPELAIGIGREILDGSRFFVGYRFAGLDGILRPHLGAPARSRFDSQGVMLGIDWWF